MATQAWRYQANVFLNATTGSYIRASIIGTYTDAALHANAALSELYEFYHPIADHYNQQYAIWRMQAGAQSGKTLGLKDLLAEATGRINDWEYRVRGHFQKGTPEFKAIFPNGHVIYQQGAQQSRIEAFEALALSLQEAHLTELQEEVTAYHAALVAANDDQKGAIGQTGQKSEDLEAARIDLCDALFYVLGGLMQHFYRTPEALGNYFKLSLIQRRPQKSFTGHTAPGAVSFVVQRSLGAGQEINLLNGGLEPLVFFLATRADAPHPPAGVGFSLEPGTERSVAAAQLGPVTTAHYLCVYNPNTAEGAWEVDI